ncbi:MAG TPA: segregation/condensation protein A [Actinomycetota bacterium]|nr:segregation/condensation protein A [Actinomycetota bacterium]
MTFEIKLEVFEGPFQLLLSLISERRVDVCEVPIAQLTNDYLTHLQEMTELDLEVTTEFLVVAATLLQLKARALMPVPAGEDPEFAGDLERDVLVSRLLELRTFQGAGDQIRELLAVGDRRFPPVPAPDDPALRQMPVLGDIQVRTLGAVLVEMIRANVRTIDVSLLVSDEVSTQAASDELQVHLARGPARFRDIVSGRSLAWAVALFLAMLEMGARGEVSLGQSERLGDIEITPLGGAR